MSEAELWAKLCMTMHILLRNPPSQAQGQQAKPGHPEKFEIMTNAFHVSEVCLCRDGQHYLFIYFCHCSVVRQRFRP